jgi:hypothetical protein
LSDGEEEKLFAQNVGNNLTKDRKRIPFMLSGAGVAAVVLVFLVVMFLRLPAFTRMSDDAFCKVCRSETPSEIEAALQNGANVNAQTKNGETALMAATDNLQNTVRKILK